MTDVRWRAGIVAVNNPGENLFWEMKDGNKTHRFNLPEKTLTDTMEVWPVVDKGSKDLTRNMRPTEAQLVSEHSKVKLYCQNYLFTRT